MSPQGGKWWVWIVIAAVVLAGVAIWWYVAYRPAPESTTAETTMPLSGEDTTAAIEQDIEAVDLGNVDEELDALDQDINQL